MKVFLRHKDLHTYGKICESVHTTVLQAQEKLCKGVNRISSARINDLQHFAFTCKCNSCIVKLQLHASYKRNMICIRMISIFSRLHFWHIFFAKIRSKALQACEQ